MLLTIFRAFVFVHFKNTQTAIKKRNNTMVRCPNCGAHSVIRTSWTAINPGRRFYCCSRTCGIINWYDPPMCERAVQIIPGLLRSMNQLQERCNQLQASVDEEAVKVQRLKWILGFSWFLFVAYLMN
ncbi:zinc finger, GRF-type [Artemisia annua]|uniref:Zinc finger, GRF-type n=1 Tax=Artemisia annua TaxID=35608 RepID=A0A2U1NIX3_ARTAN|nr:zinc finger, GRF-type [Artemisia annua]